MSNTTILRSRGSCARTSSALSSCSSSSTNSTRGARVLAQVLHLRGGVGGVDAVGDAAALTARPDRRSTHSHHGVGQYGARIRPAAKPRLSRPAPISRTGLAQSGPGPAAPEAQSPSAASRPGAAPACTAFQKHGWDGVARHHDVSAGAGCWRVSQRLAHAGPYRHVFFFFQRRSPRTPSFLQPEVELLDVVLLAQAWRRCPPSRCGRSRARSRSRRRCSAMLAFCSTSRMVVPRSRLMRTHDLEDLLGELRRQAQAGLVEQHQSGPAISARLMASICCWPPDSRPASCSAAFLQDREIAEDASRCRAPRRRGRCGCRRPSAGCRARSAAGTPRAPRAHGSGRCAHDLRPGPAP